MKKAFVLLFFLFVFAAGAGEQLPKYIILFIGDGMATPQRMMAEEFARKVGHGKLVMNHMPFHASTRTVSASSLVTDSAAAGTAIACGAKTVNGRIGLDAKGRKLQSCAEVARDKKWKVGIISTVVINHATPASFYGHRSSRQQYHELGLDLIDSNFDLFAGGGINKAVKTVKDERVDLYALARKKGYKTINSKKEYLALKPGCGKVLYSAAPGYMLPAIDTPKEGVTLADMTGKALELLKNPRGFFLMVEGGTIDLFGHNNDAASNLREVLALDAAVKKALEFMKKHPKETLVIVTGDHETGGMSMGFRGSGYAMYMDRLAFQKVSANKFRNIMKKERQKNKDLSFEDAKKLLTAYFGFKFSGDIKKDPMVVNGAQLKALADAFKKKQLAHAARNLMNQKAGIGWTTGAHTALPVLTTSAGVQGQRFTGFIDNTDISNKIKELIR